jgi:AraC family transcriptional regulator
VHDYPSITLVIRGSLEEESSIYIDHVTPLTVVIKSAGIPHSDFFGPNGCLTLQVRLPADIAFKLFGSTRARVHQTGGPIVGALLSLLNLPKLSSSRLEADDAERSVHQALALLPGNRSRSIVPLRWLAGVKDYIDAMPSSKCPTLRELGNVASVHPVHLTRQFKQVYGSSVRSYLKRRRLRAAIGAIAGGADSLTEIAHQCGYADQSHFCRDFKVFANLSPGRYRLLLQEFRAAQV